MNDNLAKRAAGYVRVSTSEQAEHGLSLDAQRGRVEGYVAAQGWALAGVFEDPAVSGTVAFEDRPGFARLLAELRDLDALVVPKLDRLGRNTRELLGLFERCEVAGVAVVSLSEGIDTSSPVGRLTRTLLAAIAEFERDRTAERVADVLSSKSRRGEWHGGRVPDGYRKLERAGDEPARLEEDPERAPVVRRVLAMGLQGLTSGEAARRLNADGLHAAARRADGTLRLTAWTPWRVRQVWRLAHYARLVRANGEVLADVRGDWPELIGADDWRRLQRVADARAERSRNRPGQRRSNRHLLAGLGRCGSCGAAMHAIGNYRRQDGTSARRYRCAGARDANGTCDAPLIDAEQVERPFLRQLDALTVDLDAWIGERDAALRADRAAVREQVAAEERRLGDLDALEAKVEADYLRRVESGEDAAADAAARGLRNLGRQRAQAEHRRDELREVLADAERAVPATDSALDLYANLERALRVHVDGSSVADVNARLREAIDHVVMTARADGSVRLQAVLSPAFMATLETSPERFAEVSPVNLGPEVEAFEGGWAARLDAPPLRRLTEPKVRAAPGW